MNLRQCFAMPNLTMDARVKPAHDMRWSLYRIVA
jgi:hypothetical protein